MKSGSGQLRNTVELARNQSLKRKEAQDRTPLLDNTSNVPRSPVPDHLRAKPGQGIDKIEISRNLRPLTTAFGS